jgi:YHS domain-containing protein
MTRNIFIFLGTFVAGAVIALVARAALFKPHANHAGHPVGGGDYSAMVSNPLVPAAARPPATSESAHAIPVASAPKQAAIGKSTTAADPHAHHSTSAASPAKAVAGKPVNTVCSICGMDVDPSLPTVEYQGQTIGFGCRMCPPKFKAEPDRYGPIYLKNEVIKR